MNEEDGRHRPIRSGYFRCLPAAWVQVMEQLSRPVSEEVALVDLSYHEDKVSAPGGRRGKFPGARKLAKRWGWTHWKVRQFMRENLRDDDSRTVAARKPHAIRTQSARPGEVESGESVENRTDAARTPHSSRTHSATRAMNTENREQTTENNTRPAKPSEASVPGGWDEVVEAYRAYRKSCGVTRLPNPKPKLGQGKHLVSCLSVVVDEYDGEPGGKIGPDRLVRLLRWLSTSGHSRAQYYRANSCDAENIRRHVSALWGLMMAESDSPSQARPHEGPQPDVWDVVEQTARRCMFDFERFRSSLPDESRDRVIVALRSSGAWTALKTASHPLDVQRVRSSFLTAWNAP